MQLINYFLLITIVDGTTGSNFNLFRPSLDTLFVCRQCRFHLFALAQEEERRQHFVGIKIYYGKIFHRQLAGTIGRLPYDSTALGRWCRLCHHVLLCLFAGIMSINYLYKYLIKMSILYLQEVIKTFVSDRSVLLVDSIWIGVLRILLLLAEDKLDWKSYTTPKWISHDEPKLGYPHSIGKIIIFFAYVTLLRMETSHFAVSNRPMNVKYFSQSLFHPGSGFTSYVQIAQNVIASVLMLFISTGYKPKLCAWVLVAWQHLFNTFLWPWWAVFAYYVFIYNFDEVNQLQPALSGVAELRKRWAHEVYYTSNKLSIDACKKRIGCRC